MCSSSLSAAAPCGDSPAGSTSATLTGGLGGVVLIVPGRGSAAAMVCGLWIGGGKVKVPLLSVWVSVMPSVPPSTMMLISGIGRSSIGGGPQGSSGGGPTCGGSSGGGGGGGGGGPPMHIHGSGCGQGFP